jgi:hypothetical protein
MAENNKKPEASLAAYSSLLERLAAARAEDPLKSLKINPKVSAKIADAYSALQHSPDNPAVQKAYNALINETVQQYKDMQNEGLKISKIKEGMQNPYPTSKALIEDVAKNKHLWYYPTEIGYGASGMGDLKHPMLRATDVLDNDGKPMLANDVFRAVHDYQGHYKGGNKFGALGEEKAYQQHRRTFSPEATKALTTETRGQNSWVNYGPYGEANRTNPASTVYAEQKAALLPDWASKDIDELSNPLKYNAKKAGVAALKFGLPAAALAGVSDSQNVEDALSNLIIPGGVESLGNADEEVEMTGEAKGYKDYQNSPAAAAARRSALKSLLKK